MTSGSELKRAKKLVRGQARERREALTEGERARLGPRIEARLFSLPEMSAAGTVMMFSSFGSEVPTGGMIERLCAESRRVALPVIVAGELRPTAYRPGDPMAETSFGASEPTSGAPVDPGDLDVIVTPGLAFDRRGFRVGYGGGFYDRLFRGVWADALRVGVCFEVQVVDQVPRGAADLPVDVIVTDAEIIRCRT